MNTSIEILGYAREPGWLPWAVQYFFLIGLSTMAFFLSLPGLVRRLPAWRGISRRALLAALVCGLTAPVALLADLHQPGRFMNFYLHPNLGSWMAWGSFFIPLYLVGLFLYAWLCLRPELAALGRRPGPLARFYEKAAYGGHDNPQAIRTAALIAGLGAALVLLYTGMEVMVVRARPMWNTPMLPVFFAVTAFAGGLGLIALFEALSGQRNAALLLNRWQARAQLASLGLVALWLIGGFTGFCEGAAETLAATQGSLGWLVTLAWLVGTMMLTFWVANNRPNSLVLSGLLALHGAWVARWVIFIGGQSLPKMGAASYSYFVSLTPDSLLGMLGTAGLALVAYIVLTSLLPWNEQAEA